MNMICISCPMGCRMTIMEEKKGKLVVMGNSCKRGEKYAYDEYFEPKRMVTTSIKVIDGEHLLASVKTSSPIKKDDVAALLEKLKKIEINAPVKIGDVILSNIKNNDAKVIATRNVDYTLK